MLKRNLFITGVLMMFVFVGNTLAQDRITTKITKTEKPNVEQATNQRPKQNRIPGTKPNARKSGGKGTTARHNQVNQGIEHVRKSTSTKRRSSTGSNIGKPQKGKYVKRPTLFHPMSQNDDYFLRTKKPTKIRKRNK